MHSYVGGICIPAGLSRPVTAGQRDRLGQRRVQLHHDRLDGRQRLLAVRLGHLGLMVGMAGSNRQRFASENPAGILRRKKHTALFYIIFNHILPKNQDVHEIEPVNNMGL